jgi:Zn-finger nucleic acid-binding protein
VECPSCGAGELRRHSFGERERLGVAACEACRGCWVEHADLERLEPGVWSHVDDLRFSTAEALSGLLCPHCGARLATVNPDDHRELAIERCPSCHGLWLDAGELSRLHEVAAQHVAEAGGLAERPDGWSRLRWITYRVAERWKQTHED